MKRSEYWNRLYNNGGNAGRPAKRKGISIFVGTTVIAVIAITAVLLTACSGAISGTGIPVEPVPTIPADSVPAAPTLAEPSAGEKSVSLTWDLSSPGYTGGDGTAATITKYTLFYDEASRYDTTAAAASDFAAVYTSAQKKDIDMSNGASKVYTVVNLEPATKYYFALRTENDNGFSALSEVKEITTAAAGSGIEPAAAPGQVGNVSTVKGDGEVTVSWTAPDPGRIAGTDQTPGVVTQYTVYYTPDSTDKVSYLAGAKVKSVVFNTPDAENKAVTSGTISGLENFKTYYFAVTASNAFAEGPGYPDASAADVSAKPAPDDVGPGAPTDVTVLPGDTKALVSWKAPADPGVYDGEIGSITGYKVYHSDKTENLEDLTAITPTEIGNVVSAEIENLTNDTEYFFVVVAVNGTEDGSASLPVSATPTAAAKYGTVPGAPTADQAAGAAESVTVTWTAPADTGQDADANPAVLSGFTVYYSTASSFTPVSAEGQKKVADNTATSVVVDGLVGETQYYFIVTASNANGESAASGTVSAVTDYSDAESVSKAAAALTGKINKLQLKGLKLTQQVAREEFEVYTGIHDTSITWQSSDNAVVAIDSETGEWTVTRPGSDAADASITLTASITKGEASQTVETSVTVPKETAASLADLSAEEFTIELRIANPIEDGGREKIEVGVNEGVEQAATALSFGSLGLEAATDFNPAGEFKWVIVAANSVEPSDKFKIDEDGKISIVANKITPTDTAFKLRAKSTGLSYEIDTFKEVDLLLKVSIGTVSGQSPADGSTTTDTTPTFSWNAVPGAVEYELRIADSPEELASASSVSVTGTSHTPTTALTNLQPHYWQVRAKDAGEQYGPWSEGQSLKVEWGAISDQSPAIGSITWDTTPELSWTEMTDAAGYEVRIADSENGLAGASSDSVTAPSYTPTTALTIGQTHYWQVRAKDGDDQFGDWSDANSLEVKSDVISGQSPADGSTTTDTTPTFSWNAVPGAVEYELRIADSPAGLASASSVSVTGTSHTPTSALTNLQTHYWQVRAKDAGVQYGIWSEGQSLKVEWGTVSGQSPADGSTTTDTTPTFNWNAVPGAVEYELRIADSPAGLASASSVSVTGTSHTPTSALTNLETHYWQVRAKNAGGQYGPWSEGQGLKVEWGAISGQSPAIGSITWDTTPELSWTEVTDAAGYEVRIADSENGLADASSDSVTAPSYTPTSALTIGQTHYWQVRAKNGDDQFGDWSDANSLEVKSDVISGQSPADGTSTTDTTPTFSWDALPDAAEYELRIADSQGGLASAPSVRVTTGTTHTPTSALANLQTHYWQVRAKNAGGQYGTWSADQSLKVEWGAINGQSPADGSITWDTTPELSWTEVTDATGYEVRIANSEEGLAGASSDSVTAPSYTPTTALTIGQTHYWQVRGKGWG